MAIIFTKQGLVDEGGIEINDVALHLNEEVIVDSGVTFEDIFKVVEKHRNIIEQIFKSFSLGVPLKSFIKEMKNSPKLNNPINFIHFSWSCDIWQYTDDDNKKKTDYVDYVVVSGVDKKDNHYAIPLVPMNELKHCPVFLDTTYEIYQIENGKSTKKLLSSNKYFTLYDFIGTLIQQITVYGDVESREESVIEINRVEDKIDNASSEEKEKNNEAVIDFLEEELERLIEEENFEKAQKIKEQLQQLKNK